MGTGRGCGKGREVNMILGWKPQEMAKPLWEMEKIGNGKGPRQPILWPTFCLAKLYSSFKMALLRSFPSRSAGGDAVVILKNPMLTLSQIRSTFYNYPFPLPGQEEIKALHLPREGKEVEDSNQTESPGSPLKKAEEPGRMKHKKRNALTVSIIFPIHHTQCHRTCCMMCWVVQKLCLVFL